MITNCRASLDAFWSRDPGTVGGNITILRKMVIMAKEELGLEFLFPPLGTYPLKGGGVDGSGMCNLEVFSQKGYICCKYTMGHHEESPNIMGQYIWSWIVGNGGHYFSRDGKKFTNTACPNRGLWLGKFVI